MAPISGKTTQVAVVSTKAWRTFIWSKSKFADASDMLPPSATAMTAQTAKARQLGWPSARSRTIGNSIDSPNTMVRSPRM
jgi:hypothetical protein